MDVQRLGHLVGRRPLAVTTGGAPLPKVDPRAGGAVSHPAQVAALKLTRAETTTVFDAGRRLERHVPTRRRSAPSDAPLPPPY